MSYCRFSSQNWMCELYCYEDVRGGWTTHVAARKRAYPPPDDRFLDFCMGKITAEEAAMLHRITLEALEAIPMVDLTKPHAGETFNDPTLEAFKERLLHLRGLGYRFPDHVLEDVDWEIQEKNNERESGRMDKPSAPDASGDTHPRSVGEASQPGDKG